GSTFFVHLKNISPASWHEEEEVELRPDVEGIRFEPATILVADNNPYNRQLLIRYLHQSPIRFLEAQNGEEAVDLARQHLPDALLILLFFFVLLPSSFCFSLDPVPFPSRFPDLVRQITALPGDKI
ncbi:MAG: response regulator, partial [bacterium]|nr:response regulator [bacterium]